MTNEELLRRFEEACFRLTNYPNNKKVNNEFKRLRKELEKKLNINTEDK